MSSAGRQSVTRIRIGLQEVGIVGLREAFGIVNEAGSFDREGVVDAVMAHLSRRNFIPSSVTPTYRRAIWREYLRHRGEDFSDFFSEVEVVVRGEPGPDLDRFVEMTLSTLAGFELAPTVRLEPAAAEGLHPRLLIHGEPVVQGSMSERDFERTVKRTLGHW